VVTLKKTLYELREQNIRNTILFVIVFSLILFAVGYFLVYAFNWGTTGLVIFGVIIIIYNIVAYEYSDKIALASARAIPADPNQYYELHNVVEEVALAAGIPKPKVYIMNEAQPNAFATGKNPQNASICVTTGLLQMMNREELQGVVAHEMSHIRNYDILLMTVVGIIAGLIIIIRDVAFRGMWFGVGERRGRRERDSGGNILMIIGLVLAIISPILVALIRAAISRQREFLADATGAYIVRDPDGLASALGKIGSYEKPMQSATEATAHMFISSPFGHVSEAFASHPPIEERIKRLLSLTV
jgi:heat shock protein HtpX